MGWCSEHKCSGISVCERTSNDITIKIFQCNINGHYWFEKWKKVEAHHFPNDVKTNDTEILIRVANYGGNNNADKTTEASV